MDDHSVTDWINQLAGGKEQAADELWKHIGSRLNEFARRKLDAQTRRRYDSLCRGLVDGRIQADNRDALWGLLAVITSRKISAQRRYLQRQKRGGGAVRGESGFAEFGTIPFALRVRIRASSFTWPQLFKKHSNFHRPSTDTKRAFLPFV